MSLPEKIVDRIEWSSLGGRVVYNEVYTDGTTGSRISVPDMYTDLPPEKFQKMKEQIEKARIGQAVQFAAPSRRGPY